MSIFKFIIPLMIALSISAIAYFNDGIHYSAEWSNDRDILFLYSKPKDTIHLLGSSYIMISLKKQTATVFLRDSEDSSVYKVSTGAAWISQGMSTPEGLFTVQSKSVKAVSKQFNNASLLSWVGFNGNIGFHGLDGSGYYHHLGVRPSSHGCVRISREDGKSLFKQVRLGTPVLVYKEEPSMVFAFSSLADFRTGQDILLDRKTVQTYRMMKARIDALYEGDYYKIADSKIFMNGTSVIRDRGFAIGKASKIAQVQRDFRFHHRDESKYMDFTAVNLRKYDEFPAKSDSTVADADSLKVKK